MASLTGNRMTKVILGIVIAGLMLGYVFPVGLNALNEDPSVTIDSNVGEVVTVDSGLEANVTAASTGTSATVELTDTESGDTEEQTVNVGDTETFSTLPGGSVNVTVDSADASSAQVTYQPDKEYGWTSAEKSIFGVLGLFLVIVPLVVLAKEAMRA